jgi:outer membrane protein assembly factor BamB
LVTQHEGRLYFNSRKDRQVKIRGNRVELDDVERTLKSLFRFPEGLVVLAVTGHELAPLKPVITTGLVMLVTSQFARENNCTSVIDIKKCLESAPPLFQPTWLLCIENGEINTELSPRQSVSTPLARTSTHKVDRVALRKQVIEFLVQTQANQSSATNTHKRTINDSRTIEDIEYFIVAAMINTLVSLSTYSPDSSESLQQLRSRDFFSLGGDSLTSIEMLYALRKEYSLPQLTIFHLKLSIAMLAERIFHKQLDFVDDNSERGGIDKVVHYQTPATSYLSTLDLKAIDSVSKGSLVKQEEDFEFLVGTSAPMLQLVWKQKLVKCVDSTPLIVHCNSSSEKPEAPSSLLFAGSHFGDFICMNALSGVVYWEQRIDEHIEGGPALSVESQSVLVTSYRAFDQHGVQRDPSVDVMATHPVLNGETNRRIYYDDQVDETRTDTLGAVRSFDIVSGSCNWVVYTMGEVKCCPVVYQSRTTEASEEHVLLGCYGGVVYDILSLSGEIVRTFYAEGSIFASPVISKDGTVLFLCTTRGFVYAILMATWEVMWIYDSDCISIFSAPVPHPREFGQVCVALTDGSICCLGKKSNVCELSDRAWCEGEIKWQSMLSLGPFFSSMVSVPSLLFPVGGIIGNHDGKVRLVDLDDHGEEVAVLDVGGSVFSTPFLIQSTVNKHQLLCLVTTTPGKCILLQVELAPSKTQFHSETSISILSEYTVPGEVFSSVVYDRQNKLLYFGSRDDHVYCLRW